MILFFQSLDLIIIHIIVTLYIYYKRLFFKFLFNQYKTVFFLNNFYSKATKLVEYNRIHLVYNLAYL